VQVLCRTNLSLSSRLLSMKKVEQNLLLSLQV
jgi:hypothetical protein